MTRTGTTGAEAAPRDRVHAVRHLYARRGDRPTTGDRAYALYLALLLGLVYVAPVVLLARASGPLLSLEPLGTAAPVAALAAAAAVWGGQLTGRFWGPLVTEPFLLHVYRSTDLPPERYLGGIARRRLALAALGTLLAVTTAALLLTDLYDRPAGPLALQGAALTTGLAALAPVAWLWGQARPVRDNLLLAAGTAAAAAALAPLARTPLPDGAGLWPAAAATALAAALLGRSAFRSLSTVDLARLARESARADEARNFALTGTLHHALDLYRPAPRGLTGALVRPDGRLRGPLAQGAVRALRTPGRTSAAVALLAAGGVALALGAATPGGGPATLAWAAGAAAVYAGSGRIGETWRGLRDELILAPLYGERGGGTPARTLIWPVTAVVTVTGTAGAAALLARGPLPDVRPAHTALLAAGALVLVLGARFLREMKTDLPVALLVPLVTPFGDLAALRVFLWQFDGLAVVLAGALVTYRLPAASAALTALALAACCAWAGLRRTGRSPLRARHGRAG
ncbi:hypothetical protein ACFCZ6_23705 [Streptomyces hydrogenans]|uniref:hypothetical protein n=1 Tax=Streptomyces hydrogenans TaxID=1873719 RepID=UPI0035E2A405